MSTDDQADSGAGLAAQRQALESEATRRGWSIEIIEDAGYSAASIKRPGLSDALARMRAGDFPVLVVAKMDRLSRSLLDFAGIMQTAQKEGWALLALDSPADLTTPSGEAMAGVMAVFSQLERRLISERTKVGLAAKRAAGVTLGRPQRVATDVAARIIRDRERGDTFKAIAERLNAEGVPTATGSGAKWWPATVRHVANAYSQQPQAA